jgi:hypothetical protein
VKRAHIRLQVFHESKTDLASVRDQVAPRRDLGLTAFPPGTSNKRPPTSVIVSEEKAVTTAETKSNRSRSIAQPLPFLSGIRSSLSGLALSFDSI